MQITFRKCADSSKQELGGQDGQAENVELRDGSD